MAYLRNKKVDDQEDEKRSMCHLYKNIKKTQSIKLKFDLWNNQSR